MPDPNDYLSGDFNPDWDSLEDLDYDPTDYDPEGGSGSFTEWFENNMYDLYSDIDFGDMASQFEGTSIPNMGGMSFDEMTAEQLTIMLA